MNLTFGYFFRNSAMDDVSTYHNVDLEVLKGTPLMLASRMNNLAVVEGLKQYGANQETPLEDNKIHQEVINERDVTANQVDDSYTAVGGCFSEIDYIKVVRKISTLYLLQGVTMAGILTGLLQ